jgi:hypothetical protein
MNTVTIPANVTAKAILEANKPPRGATHFRYTEGRRKPIVDTIKNIDCLAGCTGKLEFGKVSFEGRGRHAKITEFRPIAQAAESSNGNRVTIIEANRPPEVIEPKVEDEPKVATGRKNKIHGFSACAVAKALGKAGVKWEEANRIMRAHGIEMPKASLSVQLGFGRNQATWEKRGEPAPLTDEQIADLRKATA